MAEHKHGTMKTDVHEKTFNNFVRMSTWGAVIAILVLIFLALSNG
ncbi:MAG: aa3-type cytochrome c oxidase subunit IV [Cypionkella sp.]